MAPDSAGVFSTGVLPLDERAIRGDCSMASIDASEVIIQRL